MLYRDLGRNNNRLPILLEVASHRRREHLPHLRGSTLTAVQKLLELAGLWEIDPALGQAKFWILQPMPAVTGFVDKQSIGLLEKRYLLILKCVSPCSKKFD